MMHWHKLGDAPSEYVNPPKCCAVEFERLLDRERDRLSAIAEDDVRAERHRIITDSVRALDAYRESVATVLTDPEQIELVGRAVGYAVEVIRRAGCICEPVTVHAMGVAKPRRVAGFDPLCGAHEEVVPPQP